jgi:hypothetical protein
METGMHLSTESKVCAKKELMGLLEAIGSVGIQDEIFTQIGYQYSNRAALNSAGGDAPELRSSTPLPPPPALPRMLTIRELCHKGILEDEVRLAIHREAVLGRRNVFARCCNSKRELVEFLYEKWGLYDIIV